MIDFLKAKGFSISEKADRWAKVLTGLILIAIYAVAVLVVRWYTTPPAVVMRSVYELPYLPASYAIADEVTNIFSEDMFLGGAGGSGAPQADWTIKDYEEQGADNTLNILDIRYEGNDTSGDHITLDAYFTSDGIWLNHTTLISARSPEWRAGFYKAIDWRIEGNTLVVDREAKVSFGVWFFVIFLLVFGGIGLYAYAWDEENGFLRPRIQSILHKNYSRKMRK